MQGETLPLALGLVAVTGLLLATYTTWDTRDREPVHPPGVILHDRRPDGPAAGLPVPHRCRAAIDAGLIRCGIIGGLVALGSFGSVMTATRLDNVGEAAVLRETSTVFSALIAWLMLGEKVGRVRLGLLALIALSAVVVEAFG